MADRPGGDGRGGKGGTRPPTETALARDAARIGAELVRLDGGTDPFAAAVRATRMPMIITDPRLPDNPVVFVNDSFVRLTGYPREEILGRNCRFLQGPDTDPATVARIRAAVAAQEPFHGDVRNRRKDGEPFWNRLLLAPVRDARGEVAYFFASQVDVTLERERLANLEGANAALTAEVADRTKELAEREAWLRAVFEAVPVGIVTAELPSGRITGGNARAEGILGHPILLSPGVGAYGEWVGHHPDGRRIGGEEWPLARVVAGGEERAEMEALYRRGDGERRWVRVIGAPVRDRGGEKVGGLVAVLDVDRQRRAEEALRESEARYRQLFGAMDEGFCVVEFLDGPHGPLSDYVHVEANAAYARHAGIPGVVGRRLRDMVPDEAEGWLARYRPVLLTGEPIRFEQELVATDRILELSAFRLEPAGRRQVAVLFQDVTGRRRAEARLRESNETLERRVAEALAGRRLFADLVEGTDAFVQVADRGFRWLAVNRAAADEFERIFGVRPRVGASMLDALAHLPQHREAVRAVWARALAGERFTEVGEFGDPGRDRRHYEMKYDVLRGPGGEVVGAYQFVLDVTERVREAERLRAAEEALRQAQKMESIGQLAGGIAHDVNNMLQGVSSALELMRRRIEAGRTEEAARYVDAARQSAGRAAALTHRLLAFSRRQALVPKRVEVDALVTGMADLLRRAIGPGVALALNRQDGVWPVRGDANGLENAILNLAINARDAMPRGGRLLIETAHATLAPGDVAAFDGAEPGEYVRITVADTGEGMTPDVLAHAFEPFFTTKPQGRGTGLGLSQVYGFVRQSGGVVRIDSETGRGTAVNLYLPRHDGAGPEEVPPPPAPRTGAPLRARVLLVEDEAAVRALAAEALRDMGCEVVEAADGPAGLAALRRAARGGGRGGFDLLVTDVGLPGGMNGRQLADAARELVPRMPVLLITGYAGDAIAGEDLPDGMRVLGKPFDLDALAAGVRAILG